MANPFSEVGTQFAGKLFSGILWFGIAIIIIAVLGGTMWYFFIYKRKFNIDVKIISKRAQDKNVILFDKAAIMTDRKDGSKFFSLWYTKVKLPVPNFNILQNSEKGDYIELFRSGQNNFFYLLPPNIDRKFIIKDGDRIVPMSEQSTKRVDADMEFWNVKRKTMNKGMFDPESMWMKIIPLLPSILGGVFVVFILWILMDKLPGILAEMQELATILKTSYGATTNVG